MLVSKDLTGGCSSSFSPRSGLAFRFAKTPSFCEKEEYGAAPVFGLIGGGTPDGGAVSDICGNVLEIAGVSPSCTTRRSASDRTVFARTRR